MKWRASRVSSISSCEQKGCGASSELNDAWQRVAVCRESISSWDEVTAAEHAGEGEVKDEFVLAVRVV